MILLYNHRPLHHKGLTFFLDFTLFAVCNFYLHNRSRLGYFLSFYRCLSCHEYFRFCRFGGRLLLAFLLWFDCGFQDDTRFFAWFYLWGYSNFNNWRYFLLGTFYKIENKYIQIKTWLKILYEKTINFSILVQGKYFNLEGEQYAGCLNQRCSPSGIL